MKQIYYVFQTLLRGRGSNVIKIISLGLGLTTHFVNQGYCSQLTLQFAYQSAYEKGNH